MELNHLRVFYEVAKVGRFTEAAQRLYISQSALSRSVALLEESLAVKLFERSQKGVTLTQVGTEVFRYCEQIFNTVEEIKRVCSGTREVCEGPLRFATTDHVTNYLLVGPLQDFRNDYPAVIPSVFTGTPDEIISNLLSTECEFGLLFSKVPIPQVEYDAIREEPMSLVVKTQIWDELKSSSTQTTLNRILKKVGYISSIGAHAQQRPSRVLHELFGQMPPIGFEANGQEAQKRVCLGGGGVAYLARFMVEWEIKSGLLHEINVQHPHSFKLWLATKKGRFLSLPARMFLEKLRNHKN